MDENQEHNGDAEDRCIVKGISEVTIRIINRRAEKGSTGEKCEFKAVVDPEDVSLPLIYEWKAKDQDVIENEKQEITHTVSFEWKKPGIKDVSVKVSNSVDSEEKTCSILILGENKTLLMIFNIVLIIFSLLVHVATFMYNLDDKLEIVQIIFGTIVVVVVLPIVGLLAALKNRNSRQILDLWVHNFLNSPIFFILMFLLLFTLLFENHPCRVLCNTWFNQNPVATPLPLPDPMTGDINIAFAKFAEDDPTNTSIKTAVDNFLLQEPLSESLKFDYETNIGPFTETEKALQDGHAISATLVVWGTKTGDKITPFFVIPKNKEGMVVATSFSESPTLSEDKTQEDYLNASAKVIALFAIGLHYEYQQDYEKAQDFLQRALSNVDNLPVVDTEKEPIQAAIHFYIGKSLASIEGKNDQTWEDNQIKALYHYTKTLELNSNFAWAQLGIGGYYYDKATHLSGEQNATDTTSRTNWLEQALVEYTKVTTMNLSLIQRDNAMVQAKAHANMGTVYYILALDEYIQGKDNTKNAESSKVAYTEAIKLYTEQEEKQQRHFPYKLLADAHYGLALVSILIEQNSEEAKAQAMQELNTCIELATKDSPRADKTKEICESLLGKLQGTQPTPTSTVNLHGSIAPRVASLYKYTNKGLLVDQRDKSNNLCSSVSICGSLVYRLSHKEDYGYVQVARKVADSQHYGVVSGNSFCATCPSPNPSRGNRLFS